MLGVTHLIGDHTGADIGDRQAVEAGHIHRLHQIDCRARTASLSAHTSRHRQAHRLGLRRNGQRLGHDRGLQLELVITDHELATGRLADAQEGFVGVALIQADARLQLLRPGVPVFAEGPYGTFTARRSTRRRVVLIAGGIGITPLRALLEALPAKPGDLTLLYRARRWEEARKSAPDGCPIKGHVSAGARLYTVPWSPSYGRVKVEAGRGGRWFCSESEAQAAGWRAGDPDDVCHRRQAVRRYRGRRLQG